MRSWFIFEILALQNQGALLLIGKFITACFIGKMVEKSTTNKRK
jgi:hypothetical protein